MFRIRRLHDIDLEIDKQAIAEVQKILKQQFPLIAQEDVDDLPNKLINPLKYQLRTIVLVAESDKRKVKGFAILQHAPDLKFSYLDFVSIAPDVTRGGVGSALYARVQEEALALKSIGVFMECLPDVPELCKEEKFLKENKARMRFYEQFDVYPIINTKYETPVKPEDDCPPYLVFDGLGQKTPLSKKDAKKIVRAILIRKYENTCSPEYVDMVVDSFHDDPVKLRKPIYKAKKPAMDPEVIMLDQRMALVVNEKHDIHHVKSKGYVESPVRVKSILKGIDKLGLFDTHAIKSYPDKLIKEVHAPDFVDYLRKVCENLEEKDSIYPYVFPIRNQTRPPKDMAVRAGYYCLDTFTPLNKNAYLAARGAVDCTVTAADKILEGYRLAYSLVRPPGHHAEHRAFGGFCYFNNAAVAAHYLSKHGKVVVLDIDYHHGNGTQDIFYKRSDVLTVSIHGDPSFAYPYFSGFKDEEGEGDGLGFNLNLPLAEKCTPDHYFSTLKKALARIKDFGPSFLIIALGFDTAKNDPTGTWPLSPEDFERNGREIANMGLPTLIVQEGGYLSASLGKNAKSFFTGLNSPKR
tara:strand:- start:2367 stop:4100 length:1734 start_codon:yes stop_codon:yes gene_type:complete